MGSYLFIHKDTKQVGNWAVHSIGITPPFCLLPEYYDCRDDAYLYHIFQANIRLIHMVKLHHFYTYMNRT